MIECQNFSSQMHCF